MADMWLGLGFAVVRSFGTGLWSAIAAPFRGQEGGVTAFKHVAISSVRTLFDNLSVEQIQYVLPAGSVLKTYEDHMQQHKGIPNILKLPDGTQAFWLGNPEADKLIIYLPGGGYCIPALPNHFSHVEALSTDLKDHGKDIGVLFLIYDLAPGAKWPRQLEQAVTLLLYAIETLGKRPSDIVLQGDSSGAHLALAVLSRLAHPRLKGSIPELSLGENLGGAMLLSPWVDFRTHYESYNKNAARDVISAKSLGLWAQAAMGEFTPDEYSHPMQVPAGWWRDLPVARIFVGVGGDEVLLDSVVAFATKIKTEHSDVSISQVPREFHVEPITDFLWKLPPGAQFQAMASWLNQTFAQ